MATDDRSTTQGVHGEHTAGSGRDDPVPELVSGVAAALRRLEREAAGLSGGASLSSEAAMRRLESLQRSIARTLQQSHLESVEELSSS